MKRRIKGVAPVVAKVKGNELVVKVTDLGGGRLEFFVDGSFQENSAFALLVVVMDICIHTSGRSFDEIVQDLSDQLEKSGPVVGPPDISSTH
jgi:hypothetical protein